MDVDSIVPGTDFVQRIEEALNASGAMLVLIGRDWQDAQRQGRLDEPGDFVRIEVGSALQRKIPTIPVLVEGTRLPDAEELPEPLRPLARMQTVTLGNASWDYDMSRVTDAVARHIEHGQAPALVAHVARRRRERGGDRDRRGAPACPGALRPSPETPAAERGRGRRRSAAGSSR